MYLGYIAIFICSLYFVTPSENESHHIPNCHAGKPIEANFDGIPDYDGYKCDCTRCLRSGTFCSDELFSAREDNWISIYVYIMPENEKTHVWHPLTQDIDFFGPLNVTMSDQYAVGRNQSGIVISIKLGNMFKKYNTSIKRTEQNITIENFTIRIPRSILHKINKEAKEKNLSKNNDNFTIPNSHDNLNEEKNEINKETKKYNSDQIILIGVVFVIFICAILFIYCIRDIIWFLCKKCKDRRVRKCKTEEHQPLIKLYDNDKSDDNASKEVAENTNQNYSTPVIEDPEKEDTEPCYTRITSNITVHADTVHSNRNRNC